MIGFNQNTHAGDIHTRTYCTLSQTLSGTHTQTRTHPEGGLVCLPAGVDGNEEVELIRDLFKSYVKHIRPVEKPEDKVQVMIKLTLTNLISLVRAPLMGRTLSKQAFG